MASAKINKILIVDDEPLNRLFLADLLRMHDIVPTEAVNGREAVAQWQADDFTAIIMDIQMPEMNGIEACRLIRRLEKEGQRRKTPIIAITAYNTRSNLDDCQAAGADAYLAKPLEISSLLEALERFY